MPKNSKARLAPYQTAHETSQMLAPVPDGVYAAAQLVYPLRLMRTHTQYRALRYPSRTRLYGDENQCHALMDRLLEPRSYRRLGWRAVIRSEDITPPMEEDLAYLVLKMLLHLQENPEVSMTSRSNPPLRVSVRRLPGDDALVELLYGI